MSRSLPVKLRLLLLFFCGLGFSSGKDVVLILTESRSVKNPGTEKPLSYSTQRKDTAFVIELDGLKVSSASNPVGPRLDAAAKFTLVDHQLVYGSKVLNAAENILAQASVDGCDIAVTRRSYLSANPLYWFFALSGHPAQFSEILFVMFDGTKFSTVDLTHRVSQANVSRWQAVLHANVPVAPR